MYTVVVNNENLFSLAARTLGDATMWIYFADLNGIKDPMILTLTTLTVPSGENMLGGGVATQ